MPLLQQITKHFVLGRIWRLPYIARHNFIEGIERSLGGQYSFGNMMRLVAHDIEASALTAEALEGAGRIRKVRRQFPSIAVVTLAKCRHQTVQLDVIQRYRRDVSEYGSDGRPDQSAEVCLAHLQSAESECSTHGMMYPGQRIQKCTVEVKE